MAELTLDPLEQSLAFGAVAAAVASIPIVVMQMSSSHEVHSVGEALGAAVWLFFAVESLIMFQRSADRRFWIKTHLLEIAVVIGTVPIFLVVPPSLSGQGSVVGLLGLLRAGRTVRLLKCAKLAKAGRIVDRDEAFSNHRLDFMVSIAVILLIAGVIGTIIDEDRHSIMSGIQYWLPRLDDPMSVFPCLVVAVVLAVMLVTHRSRVSHA